MLIVPEQGSQARFCQRLRLLHSLQRVERVCRVTASDQVLPETDFRSQHCLVNPVGAPYGIPVLICYSAGLHFCLVTRFTAGTYIAPLAYMDDRLRKVPGYLLTKQDIRLTELSILSENTLGPVNTI